MKLASVVLWVSLKVYVSYRYSFFLTIRVKRLIEFRTRSCSPIYRSPLSVSFCLAKTGTRKRAKRTGRGFRGHWSRRFFSDLRALSMLKLPIDSNANVSKQVFKAKELTSLDSKIRTYHNTSLKNTKEVAIWWNRTLSERGTIENWISQEKHVASPNKVTENLNNFL